VIWTQWNTRTLRLTEAFEETATTTIRPRPFKNSRIMSGTAAGHTEHWLHSSSVWERVLLDPRADLITQRLTVSDEGGPDRQAAAENSRVPSACAQTWPSGDVPSHVLPTLLHAQPYTAHNFSTRSCCSPELEQIVQRRATWRLDWAPKVPGPAAAGAAAIAAGRRPQGAAGTCARRRGWAAW